MSRRSTGKRLRFEIFKRDGFRCVYCGATPLQALLHADHVIAVANDGKTDAANLVTSCRDCNQGKSAVPLERRALTGFDAEAAKEHAEQLREFITAQREIQSAKSDAESMVFARWNELTDESHYPLARYVPGALRDIGFQATLEAVEATARKGLDYSSAARYFCGCIRKKRGGGFEAEHAKKTESAARDAGWSIAIAALRSYYCHRIQGTPPSEFDALIKEALGVKNGESPLDWREVYQMIDVCACSDSPSDSGFVRLARASIKDGGLATDVEEAPIYVTSLDAAEADKKEGIICACGEFLFFALHLDSADRGDSDVRSVVSDMLSDLAPSAVMLTIAEYAPLVRKSTAPLSCFRAAVADVARKELESGRLCAWSKTSAIFSWPEATVTA